MTNTQRRVIVLELAERAPLGPEWDAAIREVAEQFVWGPESGHVLAEICRRRGLHVNVRRRWMPSPAGTGGGIDVVRT